MLVYIIRSLCNLCTVVCRALHCIQWSYFDMYMDMLSTYNYTSYQTKNIREVKRGHERDLNVLRIWSIKLSRPVQKINISYNRCWWLFAEHLINLYQLFKSRCSAYLLRRPFKNIKLFRKERKGRRTNFPRWRKPEAKLYLYIILPEQYYYSLKSLTTYDIDCFSYPQHT